MIVNRDQLDAQTAQTIEIWLHENLHGVSSELLGLEDAGVTEMMMMCNPVRDHGPAAWHRDFSPYYCAPLQGYTEDIIENGPRYIQWNVPLYDDDVLWVVPGSHLRPETEEETRQLLKDPRVPLPGAQQVELKAGDAVVYTNILLHWGSIYTAKLRRTVHFSYRAFGGQRIRVDLADSGDSSIGADANNQSVLTGVALLFDLRQAEIDGFDVGDLHIR